jgi:3-dehydroquinate dehydratase-2
MRIDIVNGPNLNLLGIREPEIYGQVSFDSVLESLRSQFHQVDVRYFQSNIEGELIDYLQACGFVSDGILLNAGGYTHTSVAISDTVAAINSPVIEVHISNIHAREEFRRQSLMAGNCIGMITGLGLDGYRLGLLHFLSRTA